MDELSLYYDEDKENPVEDAITFDPIPAGKTTTKVVYLTNNINYDMEIDMTVEKENVELEAYPQELPSNSIEPIEIEYSPKLIEKKPIEAELLIKVEYVVAK